MKIKEKLIEQHLNTPYTIGEQVQVRGLGLQDKNAWGRTTAILKILKEGVEIAKYDSTEIVIFENIKKYTYNLGLNPFKENLRRDAPRNINFSLDSIYHLLFGDRTEYISKKRF